MPNDIRIQMDVQDGVPVTFTLLWNGVPIARQRTSYKPASVSQWVVMLDERMGPDFQPPKYRENLWVER
jgi:hypothetical protein